MYSLLKTIVYLDMQTQVKAWENGNSKEILLSKPFLHKTLEERALDFGGILELDGEFDWGIPVGNERWKLDDDNHID